MIELLLKNSLFTDFSCFRALCYSGQLWDEPCLSLPVVVCLYQEKMRGQRRRLPVQPLGYVMSREVIFRRAEVSVVLEVCFPRRPHEGQPRSLHVMSVKVDLTFVDQNDFQKRGK